MLGASGQIGRIFCALGGTFAGQSAEIIPVFRNTRAFGQGVSWHPGAPVPPGLRADAVVALWGVTRGSDAQLSANSALAEAAIGLARQVGAGRVVHCSSIAVYAPATAPMAEDWPTRPVNAYGLSKLRMEQTALAQSGGGPRSLCLRIGNVAGADSLFAAGRAQGRITLDRFADGAGPERSYIAPRDMARVLAHVALAPLDSLPDVLNVAAPGAVAMQALAGAMGWPVSWRQAPPDARRSVVMDCSRLAALCPMPSDAATAEYLARDVSELGLVA